VGIKVEEFKPPVFTSNSKQVAPWYVNSDTTFLNNRNTQIAQLKAEENYKGEGHILKQVEIKDKKIVRGSKNLNGPGEADQILDEKDMVKEGKLSLRQLLYKKITGFNEGLVRYPPDRDGRRDYGNDPKYRFSYKVNEKEVHFVFDGYDLDDLYYPPPGEKQTGGLLVGQRVFVSEDLMDIVNAIWPNTLVNKRPIPIDKTNNLSYDREKFINPYLDYLTAEDIVGVEIMYNPNYNGKYVGRYLSGHEQGLFTTSPSEKYTYIEITTHSGQGPFYKRTPGTYTYRPLAFTLPQQFYRPKYTVKNKNTAVGLDLRSTIHWEPDVMTDKDGKATVSFYSADKPSTYSVIIEGTDLNGQLGFKNQKVIVH
jgi:hypothetical protein